MDDLEFVSLIADEKISGFYSIYTYQLVFSRLSLWFRITSQLCETIGVGHLAGVFLIIDYYR